MYKFSKQKADITAIIKLLQKHHFITVNADDLTRFDVKKIMMMYMYM